ncbi:MAG: phytoene desaturase [Candidatus Moraniibacteriota bacterium]|nr:MAG: phytoene desaturase [Candidatus Moranbacteria bacterium]
MKKIIIIGAGTGGLAAGIRLQSLGFSVEIYEKNEQVGGRMYQIKERGFTFDIGPTIVMMPAIYKEVFIFSKADPNDYIEMQRLDPMYSIHFPDKTKLDISTNLTKLIAQLESFNEEDAQGYLAYLADIYKRYCIAKKHFIEKPFGNAIDFYNPKSLYNALKLRTLNSAYSSISHFVKDEKLRQALSFQTLYIGISPFVGPSIYTIIPMIELLYGVWYIKGGMYSMAKAMEKRFLELGGKIHLNKTIDEILIQNKKIQGIQIGKKKIQSDIVLCNADFPWAIQNLIKKERNRGKYQKEKLQKMEYSSSSFILYLGLTKKYPTNVHTIRFAKNFNKNIKDLFNFTIPNDPSFYIYSPSQIDPTMAPEGKEVLYILIPVPSLHNEKINWTKEKTESYKNKILKILEKIPNFEDIRKHIEIVKVFTPETFQEKFNFQYGATFGLKPTLLQSNYFRPQNTFKPIKGLYFTGSSNHPGAGVPLVLTSAKLATNEIIKDYPNTL